MRWNVVESEAGRPSRSDTGRRGLVTAAAIVVVVWGLKAGAPILVPAVLALFVGLVSWPLMHFLMRRRWPRWLALVGTLVVDALVLAVLGLLAGRAVGRFAERAPGYLEQLQDLSRRIVDWLVTHELAPSEWSGYELADFDAVMQVAGRVVGGTVAGALGIVSLLGLVLLLLIFALAEAPELPGKLRPLLGRLSAGSGRVLEIIQEIRRYLVVKTVISVATGLVVGGWVWVLRVDFPVLWGLVAFLLNYIPNIGSIVAAVPPALVALVQHNPGRALLVLAGFFVVNTVLGNLVEPAVMGRRLGLSPLVVLLAVVFWGWVWGPIGALLSVPLTSAIRILLENTEGGRPWAQLLGRASSDGVAA